MKQQPAIVSSSSDRVYPDLDMTLPGSMPVSVIIESKPSTSPWLDTSWQAIAVTISNSPDSDKQLKVIHNEGDSTQYLFSGLKVALYKDECESYYHNLVASNPRCYVIAHVEEGGAAPQPFLITMSFDEAHAYLEGDDEIYDVDVPPELYRWTEAFLLIHYAPEKKYKRKRDSWKDKSAVGER